MDISHVDHTQSSSTLIQTYFKWAACRLQERLIKVDTNGNPEDFKSGVTLCHLIELTAGITLNPVNEKTQTRSDKYTNECSNVQKAMDMMKHAGIETGEVHAKDIVKGDMKTLLDVLWLILIHFEIHDSNRPVCQRTFSMGKRLMLEWFSKELPELNIDAESSFVQSFQDGNVLHRISLKYCSKPQLTKPYHEETPLVVLKNAVQSFENELKVPSNMICVEQLVKGLIDEHVLLIYLATLKRKITSLPSKRSSETESESGQSRISRQQMSTNSIQKVSLVKLTPLEKNTTGNTSPLSPNTLTRLVEEQKKSHEAIEALQQRIQADIGSSLTSDVRKELEQSALKQRNFLNKVLSTPSSVSAKTQSFIAPEDQAGMLTLTTEAVTSASPLAKRLFPDGFRLDDITDNGLGKNQRNHSPGSHISVEAEKNSIRRGPLRSNKKSDADNDTGVETDSGSDAGVESPSPFSLTFPTSHEGNNAKDFLLLGQSSPLLLKHTSAESSDDDPLLLYLEAIEERALAVESLIEKAKLDTVVNLRHQLEAEFNGVSLEEIPSKCHQKIDRAIQRYLERELENIRAEYESGKSGNQRRINGEELQRASTFDQEDVGLKRENSALKEKIESLEESVSRVDMLYVMQKKENQYLTEKLSKLERQMANEKLKHENELDNIRNDLVEEIKMENGSLKQKLEVYGSAKGNAGVDHFESSSRITSLYRKLEQEEKQNMALKIAGEADQTTIRCLEGKLKEMEGQLKSSRKEVSDLLSEIHELQENDHERGKQLRRCEMKLKEVLNERHVLRETLKMSEHEISLLENKLGDDNNSAWKESKKEILEELRKLEKHIKVIHKEKRKLENKYLAFKIENENLSDSLNSFSRAKDILTPLGSCDVSRRESNLSSHSSSRCSSLTSSDIEDEGTYDDHYCNKNKSLHHQSSRRRRRGQDHKDKQFAEAVAKKLLFAQKAFEEQNCNFSSFQNSGEDLSNEADELVKRVDSLQAEKLAIKMELESIRSTQTENVKC